jgi:hypothetical protein
MPVPDFSPGEVLTASAMDSIGMWEVASATVAPATGPINILNIFNANFDNYRIVMSDFETSLQTDIRIRLLAGTTPLSVSYYATNIFAAGGSISSSSENNVSSWRGIFTNANTGIFTGLTFDLLKPFESKRSVGFLSATGYNGSDVANRSWTGFNDQPNSHTGLQLFSTVGGTFGFKYNVYGYRN